MIRRRLTKDYSGRFLVRIPVSLHRTIAEQALGDRISLNQYVLFLLARGAGEREFERFLKSMKDTTVEALDSIIESEKLVDTPRAKLRLIGLTLKEAKLEKPAEKLYLDGDLSIDVTESQEVLKVEEKEVGVCTTYEATIKSKDSGEEIRLSAKFDALYQAMRPISKELARGLDKTRLAIYPSRVFRELLNRLISNLNLNIKIG